MSWVFGSWDASCLGVFLSGSGGNYGNPCFNGYVSKVLIHDGFTGLCIMGVGVLR